MTEQPEQNRVNIGPGGNADIANWFTYHPPTHEQIPLYEAIRAKGGELATLIANVCPPGPDRSTALRSVRESVMWANAAIACDPRQAEPETVNVEVTLPGGVERCEASSYQSDAVRQQYGPGGYNRCVRSLGHDLPTAELPGTPHTDTWGVQWRVNDDGGFRQIGTLDKDRLRALIEDEGTQVQV